MRPLILPLVFSLFAGNALAQWRGADGAAGPAARVAMERIARAAEDGLDPRHYPLPDPADPLFDQHMTQTVAAFVADLTGGRVRELISRPDIVRGGRAPDATLAALAIAAAPDPAAALGALEPASPAYRAVKAALAREVAAIATAPVPFEMGGTIEPDTEDPRVPAIRERLGVAGEGLLYDAPLQEAVRRYQAERGLAADARIGRNTQAALNEGPAARARRLRVALDMLRDPPHWAGPRIEVNVAEQRLRVLNGEEPVLEMNVVVGSRARPTPMLRTALTAAQFNPPWGVPMRNAKEDLLPKLRANPEAVIARGFRAYQSIDGERVEVDIRSVDWSTISADRFPFILRQDAGETNALGRIKFVMPNRDDIFMHDTPERRLFAREQRFYSSGCIRLEKPYDLLAYVFGWDRARADAAIARGTTFGVSAPRQLPVIIGYRTAAVAADGSVSLRPDAYGLDEAYARLLDRMPTRIAAR